VKGGEGVAEWRAGGDDGRGGGGGGEEGATVRSTVRKLSFVRGGVRSLVRLIQRILCVPRARKHLSEAAYDNEDADEVGEHIGGYLQRDSRIRHPERRVKRQLVMCVCTYCLGLVASGHSVGSDAVSTRSFDVLACVDVLAC